MPFLKRGLTWRVCPASSPAGTQESSCLIWGPDGKSAPVFSYSVVSPLSLSCLPKRQLNRHSTVFDRTLPMNYSSPPIPSCSERSLDISPSQRPPTGRVLCSEDPTASRYWLLCALLTPIMMSQECTGTKDQKISFVK